MAVARDVRRNLKLEADAASVLLAKFATIVGEDEEAKQTLIEGETGLYEAFDAVLERFSDVCEMKAAIKSQIARLQARHDRLDNQGERIREVILDAMVKAEIKTLERPAATLTVAEKPRQLEVIDESKVVATRFWTTPEPKLDRKALLKALKDGEDVEGCVLGNGGITLRVGTL